MIAGLKFGVLDRKALHLKTNADVFKFMEKALEDPAMSSRFDSTSGHFKPTRVKASDCMSYDQTSVRDHQAKSPMGEDLKMKVVGLMCLHPGDPQRFVFLTVSERTPVSREFQALAPVLESFADTLKFESVKSDAHG